jgi:hypothetical protein
VRPEGELIIRLPMLRGPSPCDGCEFLPLCAQRGPDSKALYACMDFVQFTVDGKVRRERRAPSKAVADYLEERVGYQHDYERAHQARRLGRPA